MIIAAPSHATVMARHAMPTQPVSAAQNKWIKTIIGGDYVVHGLQHSLRDRLRAVECPSDIIDQIGGWTTTGIDHAYGKGYSVEILAKWMERIQTSFLFD